jgi:CHAT domain-containing protein
LIEQPYNIALLPGLQLFEPQRLQQRKLRVIAAGLSKSPLPEFSPLDSVATELKEIQAEVPSVELLNQAFTRPALIAKVSTLPFPVIHLATHGEFSSKVDETFILAWDGRIKLKQLDTMLKTSNLRRTVPIELLVLSACETVVGDQQAALGLAGVAVRAGARSTLATLWQVDDQATASLIGQFYQELAKPNVSKAEALGKAQRFLAEKPEYQHPYYWAPFVLVGNWM